MYRALRQLANAVLTRGFLLQHEELIRWPYAVWFAGGTKYQCNICHHWLRGFIELDNGDSLCPFCGSSSRNRRLWQLLQPQAIEGRVLHFSPARPLYRRLEQLFGDRYVSTDYQCEFLADQSYDIARIPEADNSFDLLICFHVLEHIEDDLTAISELQRVLKPGGIAYVQTPFREGTTYENPAITSRDARLEHFGQEDHVRVYSVSGLTQRLATAGFVVSSVSHPTQDCTLGLSKDETVLECKKRVDAERVAA